METSGNPARGSPDAQSKLRCLKPPLINQKSTPCFFLGAGCGVGSGLSLRSVSKAFCTRSFASHVGSDSQITASSFRFRPALGSLICLDDGLLGIGPRVFKIACFDNQGAFEMAIRRSSRPLPAS